ncbi:N-terminal C2 in EEIG1 and EHBP1 proteins-domain-containing protein [Pisolithus marmoratus]|nr:N-terminal C2 in EEIG1 and EHBP1 proteins-domain-containing protein [Pisolithus marmoratus]
MLTHEQRSFSGLDVNTRYGDTHATLAADASTSAPSLRHRSSTLKPSKKHPARLNLLPPSPASPSNDSPLLRPPAPVSRTKSSTYPSALPTTGHTTATARPLSPGTAPSLAPTPSHPTGIRAHFAQLLPRHAVFLVRFTIHQLNNVPLVRGEFGLRWKVKGVTNGGILGKVKGKAKGRGKLGNAKGNVASTTSTAFQDAHDSAQGQERAKESDRDSGSLLDHSASASVSDTHSVAASSSAHSHSYDHGLPASLPRSRPVGRSHAQTFPHNIPALVVSSNSSHAPSAPVTRSVSGTSIVSTPSSAHSKLHSPAHYLSAEWHPHSQTHSPLFTTATHEEPSPSLADTPPSDGYTPAKGQTPFVQLKDHNVVWEQTLDFVVQMNVGRESGELGDCPAKLVVMQRVIPGDADAPRNPRVGAIHLNLAQYVDAGVVTRRYLLRQSKTNATLKLTIQLEHTGGATSYTAPPLPKGEILSGVTGILESDTYLNRPRTLGLYSSSSGSSDSLSSEDSSPSALHPDKDPSKVHGARRRQKKPKRKCFDPSKLPDVRGPRATEKFIEAIFNPVPVTSTTQVNPFTYLIGVYDEQDGAYEGGDQESLRPKCKRETSETSVDANECPFFYGDTPLEGEGDERAREQGTHSQDSENDYHSVRSRRSGSMHANDGEQPLRNKRSLRSIGSRLGLRIDSRSEHDDAGESTMKNNGHVDVGEEKKAWWQKVLRPA